MNLRVRTRGKRIDAFGSLKMYSICCKVAHCKIFLPTKILLFCSNKMSKIEKKHVKQQEQERAHEH